MSLIKSGKLTLDAVMDYTAGKDPGQKEFLQAVHEVMHSLVPFINENKKYQNQSLIKRFLEPERVVMFRVPWHDEDENAHVNRGYRVQFNSALGPYKGGLRFHPSVNLSIMKFLAFEQILKNSLTGLSLGGAKGGADFNPRGRTDEEIMRFCQSFMTELSRHIGPETDIPAGDIGVGTREIGYLFGQYKRLKNTFTGVLTGKDITFGGSHIRPQSTGYGLVYFTETMLNTAGDSADGKKVVLSGSGNVAQYACEKITELGGTVTSMSDSDGFIYVKDGIDTKKLEFIKELKNRHRGRISECTEEFDCEYAEGKPWKLKCDIALPCATENEIHQEDARELIKNGVKCVAEGANMPCTEEAFNLFQQAGVLFSPGKASNAGGVAVSGLEMSQNAVRLTWDSDTVDKKLQEIMKTIHNKCAEYGETKNRIDYVKGANIAGFIKVADAMLAQGDV